MATSAYWVHSSHGMPLHHIVMPCTQIMQGPRRQPLHCPQAVIGSTCCIRRACIVAKYLARCLNLSACKPRVWLTQTATQVRSRVTGMHFGGTAQQRCMQRSESKRPHHRCAIMPLLQTDAQQPCITLQQVVQRCCICAANALCQNSSSEQGKCHG